MEAELLDYPGLFSAAENNYAGSHEDKNYFIGEEIIYDLFNLQLIPNDAVFDLRTDAHLLQLAYRHNKLLSLSNSRTQILAHQVESTHRIINSLNRRFLIADEVGLGKTIEAGLVIKELIFRNGVSRILVVAPASLLMQWQNELQSKFNERFIIMDRSVFLKSKRMGGKNNNPWDTHKKVICSLDFVKSKAQMEELKKTEWDVVVFDEAHRLRRDSLKSTLSYNAAQVLSEKTRTMLLLTATPFRGRIEELYYLIRLLDKNLLGPYQTFYGTYCLNNANNPSLKEKLSSIIIRRTKKEVGGFTSRRARTMRFEFFPEERELYDATTNYVVEEFNLAMETENRAVGFVMTVFQKLLDSSCAALLSALEKRKIRLECNLENMKNISSPGRLLEKDLTSQAGFFEDPEDVADIISETARKNMQDLGIEIKTLETLIGLANKVAVTKKGEKLLELILKLNKSGNKKVLIFTQFRTTQDYIRELLAGFKTEIFNGSMDKNRKEDAIRNFKEKSQILISTEAGGEGRNLQFCHILINYDLPWSPLKIEQRIGRIHRFGQPRDVQIYNFSVKDTISERVLEVLTKKLKLFEESIGTPDILLGQIEEELNFNRVFMEMAAGKSPRVINAELDRKIEAAKVNYEKLADLSVAKNMDFNYDEYYKITLKERQYSNSKIEDFVNKLRSSDPIVGRFLGKKGGAKNLYPIKAMPGDEIPGGKYGTFQSEKALENENIEFLAFGNPIIDNLFGHCRGASFGGKTGLKIVKASMRFSGIYFNYMAAFTGASEIQELIPVLSAPLFPLTDEEKNDFESGIPGMEAPGIPLNRGHKAEIERIRLEIDLHITDARQRILEKVKKRHAEIHSGLDRDIILEMEKIRESYDKKINEYEKQLEHQICQMKWFDKDMKSAISRTKSRILDAVKEKERELNSRKEYLNTGYKIELINACIVIARL